ncbi:MAG: alpha/beta hydrolase, partial [Hydrogenophaga sp.]|nr:alpha/beta hydrolase [Hydrogenophaga sp.]
MTASTPPKPPQRAALRHVRPSDLRSAAQLASQATLGVINISEGVHQSVLRRLGFSGGAVPEQTGGLTGQ